MSSVLLVEDDRSLGKTLAERLVIEGLDVEWVETYAGAVAAARSRTWDLAIVDVMLPDGSGFDLAPEIRGRSYTPIMFMTALNSAESRLTGFELGADEYLPKPFHLKEFLLRVRHVLTTQPARRQLAVGDVTIDWDAMAIDRPAAGASSCRCATIACWRCWSRRRHGRCRVRRFSIGSGAKKSFRRSAR